MMTTRKELAASRRRQKKINTIMFITGGILVVIAVIFLLSGNSSTRASGPAQIGKSMEDFSLTDVHGKTVRLSDYAGKTVLINAWATWCPPCKAEMPDLNVYYQTHQDKGFVILAVNAGDPVSDAAAFANQKGLSFPVLVDPNTDFLTSLGINSFPTSILVGPDRVIRGIHVGMFTPESLEAEITPHLQN
jgi:peroxiredoxin